MENIENKIVVTKVTNIEQLKKIIKPIVKQKDYVKIEKKTPKIPKVKKPVINSKAYAKKYREANKDKNKKYQMMLIKCECGAEINYGSRYLHLKSARHIKKMDKENNKIGHVYNLIKIDEESEKEEVYEGFKESD